MMKTVRQEINENLEYITEIEAVEIPKVWQEKILQPIDFAIAAISKSTAALTKGGDTDGDSVSPVESA